MEKKSHANFNDPAITYKVESPEMIRSVFAGDNVLIGRNIFKAGELVPMHSHEHEQFTLIISGECDVTCGGETFHLTPGGICWAPSNVEHEIKMWDEGEVEAYDIFYPVREDWLTPLEK